MIRVCPHSDSKCPNGMTCTYSCATGDYDGTKRPAERRQMTDTTAGEGKYDWPVTEHGIATDDEVEAAIVRLAADDAVLAYRIQGRFAAQPSAGAQDNMRDWQPMRTAPKDGTEIETLCVHPTAHYSKDAFGEGWAAVVKAKWIDHNNGGWTWNGLCGALMAWRPLATPAQPDTGDVAALREAELEADMERDLTESDQEAIERSLRVVLAFDAVSNLRSVLSETMKRQASGYDWNADPDRMTLRQSAGIEQADRILAALSKPNAQGAHEGGGA